MSLFNVLKTVAIATGMTSGAVSGSTKVVYKTTVNVAKATGTAVVKEVNDVDYKELRKVVRDNHISTDQRVQRAAGTLPTEVKLANELRLLELIEGVK